MKKFNVKDYEIDSGFNNLEKANIFICIRGLLEGQSINIKGYEFVINDKQLCILAERVKNNILEPYLMGLDNSEEFGSLIRRFADISEEQKVEILNNMVIKKIK